MLKLLVLLGAISGSVAACVCGLSCKQLNGGAGFCQTNGECAVNIVAPQCPKLGACECGQHCQMSTGGSGVCQVDGECAVSFQAPQCVRRVEAVGATTSVSAKKECPVFKCKAPDCPVAEQETPKNADGCQTCPRCVTPLLTSTATTTAAIVATPTTATTTAIPATPATTATTTATTTAAAATAVASASAVGKCECGKRCAISGGSGVCQEDGKCTLSKKAPKCNKKTDKIKKGNCGVCGSVCTAKKGEEGICQPDGECKSGKRAPLCGSNNNVCPMLKCLALACPLSRQETLKGPNGCPLCPRCEPCPLYKCLVPKCPDEQQETPLVDGCRICPRCKGVCTIDEDCGESAFCNIATRKCVTYLKTGDQCSTDGENSLRRCAPGSVCPFGSRTCTVCLPLPCPLITCSGELETTVLSNGCPGCRRCKNAIGN